MGINSINLDVDYINTSNTTADKSQDIGRDSLEAKAHMLDGQLDNKENTFINFTSKDGSKYQAFRSKNTTGTYYGFRKSEEANQAWQDLKAAPVELQKTLDQAHSYKLESIKQMGGDVNYKLNQKALGEIQDLNDLYRYASGQINPHLDTSRKEALLKIEALKSNPSGFDQIKQDHPELVSDLVLNRLEKASKIIGEDKLANAKQNLENELTKLGAKVTEHGYSFSEVKNKEALSESLNKANTAIDTKINEIRNAAQRLNDTEQAEYTKLQGDTEKLMKKLAADAKNPELSKLQERYKELSGPLDQNQGKYSLTQLRAFKTQLDQKLPNERTFRTREEINAWLKDMPNGTRTLVRDPNGGKYNYYTKDIQGNVYQDSGHMLAEKLDPSNKYIPFQSDSRFIIQKQENNDYQAYKVDIRYLNSRIIPYYDEQTKSTKVFAVNEDSGNKKYQELQAIRIDRANIDAYKIKDGLEDKYYMFAANKKSLWELKLPIGEYGFMSVSQSNYRPDGAKTATVDGLNFNFDQNGNLIGLAAPPTRAKGLAYEPDQISEARKNIFID